MDSPLFHALQTDFGEGEKHVGRDGFAEKLRNLYLEHGEQTLIA